MGLRHCVFPVSLHICFSFCLFFSLSLSHDLNLGLQPNLILSPVDNGGVPSFPFLLDYMRLLCSVLPLIFIQPLKCPWCQLTQVTQITMRLMDMAGASLVSPSRLSANNGHPVVTGAHGEGGMSKLQAGVKAATPLLTTGRPSFLRWWAKFISCGWGLCLRPSWECSSPAAAPELSAAGPELLWVLLFLLQSLSWGYCLVF